MKSGSWSKIIIHSLLGLIALAALIPFLLIVAASFSDEMALTVKGYSLWPRDFNLSAYQFIFDKPGRLLRAYGNTIAITVLGTSLSLVMMSLFAYALSRQLFRFRRIYGIFLVVAMLFSGGLVPYYILVTQVLKLQNTFIILLLPNLIGLYQIIILTAFFRQLPNELFDAARVDGAGEWRIYGSLVVPMGKPALATVGLMIAILYWNNWTTPLYFIRDPDLYTLQYLLYQVMRDAEILALEPQIGASQLPTQATTMAMAVLATGPAAFGFFFAQKYLVRGITMGSLK